MKTTRRDFLRGLFATGATLAVAPRALVELVHGASDLTPQERDVAAEVMGLRTKQWRGWIKPMPEHWFDAQRYLQGPPGREQEILYGVPGGEMPVGIIRMNPDGRPMAGQISACTNTEPSYVGKSPLESVSWELLKSLPALRAQWNMYDPEQRILG